MIRSLLLMTAAAVAAPAPVPALPGFAAQLSKTPPIDGPPGWTSAAKGAGWPALIHAGPAERQASRWGLAARLIAQRRAPEALGVLEVMAQDDRDLAMVPAFQLARGAALAQLGRADQALAALGAAELAANPEACAWRLRAFAAAQMPSAAIGQVGCAAKAINARTADARAPFVLAAAGAALAAGQPAQTLTWLKSMSAVDPAGNILRARAQLALGQIPAARQAIADAEKTPDPELRAEARLFAIEAAVAAGTTKPAEAIKQLELFRFAWRGGEAEQAALELEVRLANQTQDIRAALSASATLLRYFRPGAQTPALLRQIQTMLAAMLAPDSKVGLPEAAGLYWNYREFGPAGADGDAMVSLLADRLEAADLPGRAADLLDHQLSARTTDVARGPLSVRVATLRILAGQPERVVPMLHASEDPSYSDAMRWDRKRLEAVALFQTGKSEAAMAALQDVPDAAAIGAEIQWKKRDWNALAANRALPAGRLSEVGQAVVLRHAIALAMLGRETELQALRARYLAAFAKLPSAAAFDVLTQKTGAIDPDKLAKAMASIPSASPAGSIADLLDAGPAQ